MKSRHAAGGVAERLVPLSKQEIDRRIEGVIADLAAALEVVATEGGPGGDPLLPRGIPSGALTSRLRNLLANN